MTTTPTQRRRRRAGAVAAAVSRGWSQLLETPSVWIAFYLAAGLVVLLPEGHGTGVRPGDIATRSWVANRDLLWEDHETTLEKRTQARSEVLAVYDFEPGTARAREDELTQLFEVGRSSLQVPQSAAEEPRGGGQGAGAEARPPQSTGVEPSAALEALLNASQLKLTPAQLEVLRRHRFSPDLEERLKSVISRILRQGVVNNKAELLENHERGVTLRDLEAKQEMLQVDLYRYLGYPEEAREMIEAESRRWLDFDRRERAALQELLLANVSPNLHQNRSESLARREAAAAATPEVFQRIRAGQVIVRKGDEIDATAARFINEMLGGKGPLSFLMPAAGQLLFLVLGCLTLWAALRRETFPDAASRARTFCGLLLLVTISLLCLSLSVLIAEALGGFFQNPPFNSKQLYLYAIPFASVALVSFLLFGRSIALISSVVFSLEAGQFVDQDVWGIVLYALAGSLAAVYFLDQVKRRSTVLRAGLFIGLVNGVAVLLMQLLQGAAALEFQQLGLGLAGGLAGGLLVAAVAGFTVPLFEWLLPVTTDITLIELSNTNLPLLRRLAFEAPGTFQHSLMVANLAKAGCGEIGADSVLAYTAALYHDIGKVNRPEYFIENQRGQNPHDELQASLSAQIVISHVTKGLELAREARLPTVLQDAIAEHHGTSVLTYFHNRAVEANGGRPVDDEPYRYPGPRPRSREMGALMLADAVEAASRSLADPTPITLRSVVDQIFDAHLRSGQLDDTHLTLGDLKVLAAEFRRVLDTSHHRRVDYPGFDFRADSGRGPLRVVGS
ncbi:MAG TPA: HDIG domain-containing protein [Thermoanaerobaculia bacterium]|nr:HDIG domain-containing protein [Thermoanaerobaculia bacterium]